MEEVRKPLVVEQYNLFMGGVDNGDQLLSYYEYSHRTLKWWRRGFFHLLDVAIVNAYIMYLSTPCSGRRLTHKEFRLQLAQELLMETTELVNSHGHRPSLILLPTVSQGGTFPVKLSPLLLGNDSSRNMLFAVGREEVAASPPPSNASSVTCQCAWYLVLSCTIQKHTQNAIYKLFIICYLYLSKVTFYVYPYSL